MLRESGGFVYIGTALTPRRALVVLGCRVQPGGDPSPALARRLAEAARLYASYGPATIVVSGGRSWHGTPEAVAMRRQLLLLGIPEAHLVSEGASQNTLENARLSTQVLLSLNFAELGIVTCDFHMPRALFAFRRYGWSPDAFPAVSPFPPVGCALLRAQRERLSMWRMRLSIR